MELLLFHRCVLHCSVYNRLGNIICFRLAICSCLCTMLEDMSCHRLSQLHRSPILACRMMGSGAACWAPIAFLFKVEVHDSRAILCFLCTFARFQFLDFGLWICSLSIFCTFYAWLVWHLINLFYLVT